MQIEEKLVKILIDKKLNISACVSCTGGLFIATLVNVPGISEVLESSIITYSNNSKIIYAGLNEKIIQKYGVVSEQVVYEMAAGIRKKTGTNIGVSVSGVAGPSGGTPEIPVGRVCFGIDINGAVRTYTKDFLNMSRSGVRKTSVKFLINELIKLLGEK